MRHRTVEPGESDPRVGWFCEGIAMNQAYNGQNAEALSTPPRSREAVGGRVTLPTYKPIPESVLQRPNDFWACVAVDMYDTDACWPWLGYIHSEGYGRTHRSLFAHRVAYVLQHGQIPDGLTIDHLCGNRACCNPAHLEAVPVSVNVRRRLSAPSKIKYQARKRSGDRYDRRRKRGVCTQCNTPTTKARCDRCAASHNARNKGRKR
jgi:hypothetical protein